jgi:hypothetical protein
MSAGIGSADRGTRCVLRGSEGRRADLGRPPSAARRLEGAPRSHGAGDFGQGAAR